MLEAAGIEVMISVGMYQHFPLVIFQKNHLQSARLVIIEMRMCVRRVDLIPGLTLLQEQRSLSAWLVLVVRSPVEKSQLHLMTAVSLGSLGAV